MRRQLAEQADEPVRNRLRRGFGSRTHEIHHGSSGHAGRGLGDETAPLHDVSAHAEQTTEGVGLHRRDQHRRPAPQLTSVAFARRSEFVGDLQQVADDDFVVRFDPLMLVDGLGQNGRFDLQAAIVRLLALDAPFERGPGESDPELHRWGGLSGRPTSGLRWRCPGRSATANRSRTWDHEAPRSRCVPSGVPPRSGSSEMAAMTSAISSAVRPRLKSTAAR